MKKILYILPLFVLFSCSDNENFPEDSDAIEPNHVLVEKDGVVYPSTSTTANTRTSYSGTNIDWVNASKVTLPNGEHVDLPWVDGGSLPFYMQEKLSPENGWELIAHTMAPDTQRNRSYLLFHNYASGMLRVFCYMSTFATNNNGCWKITFSEPTKLLNFTGQTALAMDKIGPSEIIVSNSTTQDSKGFALGWNGFELELAYDPTASGIMKIEAMNVNTTSIGMNGGFKWDAEGNIVGTTKAPATSTKLINGIGKYAGKKAENVVKDRLPRLNIPTVGKTLYSLGKSGVFAAFESFSGLFDRKKEEVKHINLSGSGTISVEGTAITQSAAPIVPINIHLNMINGKLGGWNLEKTPVLEWFTTVFNDYEANKNVTNREYFYEVPSIQNLHYSYIIYRNPKANVSTSIRSSDKKIIRHSFLPSYVNEGTMNMDKEAIYSQSSEHIYKDKMIEHLKFPYMRTRICLIEYPTSEGLPQVVNLPEAQKRYTIREYTINSRMDLYIQVCCNFGFTINGVENAYYGTKIFQPRNDWGDAY